MKKITLLLSLLTLSLSLTFSQELPTPDLTLKTNMVTGERITIRLAANPASIIIDWGDGAFIETNVKTAFDSSPTSIGYTLAEDNPTIRIWGKLVNLRANNNKLTSIEFGGNQWNLLRRMDIQNNELTSVVFPADANFAMTLGTVNAYNNKFEDVCDIEMIYKTLPDRSLQTLAGGISIVGNGTDEGLGNEAQNNAIRNHSKISLATARGWKIIDSELEYADGLANPLQESSTAEGCVESSVNSLSANNGFYLTQHNLLL